MWDSLWFRPSFSEAKRALCVALFYCGLTMAAAAHEVLPAIADMRQSGDVLIFDVRLNAESFLAGIDQSAVSDTDDAPQAAQYDAFRALQPSALEAAFQREWPRIADGIRVVVDGSRLGLALTAIRTPTSEDIERVRTSEVQFEAALPAGASDVTVGWVSAYGTLVVRQMDVGEPYDGYLEAGAESPPIPLAGGRSASAFETFWNYIPVGFDHIVPKGLDHILFVLGLFLLSTRIGALLWQISAFTLAHTLTLALAALGYVAVPASIVEPLIAASIVYVAVENLYATGLSRWRPVVIFGFGLLHGLGFASVLAEFGLPEGRFIPALVGFNVGVELGQIAVVAIAYAVVLKAARLSDRVTQSNATAAVYLAAMLLVTALVVPAANAGQLEDLGSLIGATALLLGFCAAAARVGRLDGYRDIVAMPGSIVIAVVAAYWCVERVFL
ncbi:MAG: HupE/UreJ family protein [Pseudomonadota bacterium]